jgi:hypothetical protein
MTCAVTGAHEAQQLHVARVEGGGGGLDLGQRLLVRRRGGQLRDLGERRAERGPVVDVIAARLPGVERVLGLRVVHVGGRGAGGVGRDLLRHGHGDHVVVLGRHRRHAGQRGHDGARQEDAEHGEAQHELAADGEVETSGHSAGSLQTEACGPVVGLPTYAP